MKDEPQFPGLRRRGYTIAETAYMLSTTEQTVRNMIHEKKLHVFTLAGKRAPAIRVSALSLEEYIGDGDSAA